MEVLVALIQFVFIPFVFIANELTYHSSLESSRAISECPTICPLNIDPVCGSDGVTYQNECRLLVEKCQKKSDLQVVSTGDCPECPTICPLNIDPVCGCDGVTYQNECRLLVEKCQKKSDLQVVSTGDCQDGTTDEELKEITAALFDLIDSP